MAVAHRAQWLRSECTSSVAECKFLLMYFLLLHIFVRIVIPASPIIKYITSVEQSCPRIPRFLVTTVQLRVVLYRLCLQSTLQHILYRSRITARSWLEWTKRGAPRLCGRTAWLTRDAPRVPTAIGVVCLPCRADEAALFLLERHGSGLLVSASGSRC